MCKRELTIEELRQFLSTGSVSDRAVQRLAHDERVGVRALAQRELRKRAAARAERKRLDSLQRYERDLWDKGTVLIAGVDEVGVGPLAGPVLAAAVILPAYMSIEGVDDSKKLDEPTRAELARVIRKQAIAVAVGSCSVEEIEQLNIYHASCEAMRRAVTALGKAPEHLLVDARRVPGINTPQTPIIDGDALSHSIAAASIIAKVERDSLMEQLARDYPGYGFEKHKGYATAAHLEALRKLGCCPMHRPSYAPVAEALRAKHRSPDAMKQFDLFARPNEAATGRGSD